MNFRSEIWNYRALIWQMTKREIAARYRGSMMGMLWSFLYPFFMLAVYAFFFTVIYQARWNVHPVNKIEFAMILFAGLIPYNFFAECINRAPKLLLSNVNYIKKVVFPVEILPWVEIGVALFHMITSYIVLFAFLLIANHSLPWTILLLPVVNLPLILIVVGLSWFLSSLAVYVRDTVELVTIFTTVLLFLSPIFYSVQQMPAAYRAFIKLNPLTFILEQNRAVIISGKLPNWNELGISIILGVMIASLGYYWFSFTRHSFADVL